MSQVIGGVDRFDEDRCSLDRTDQSMTTSGAAADLFILRPRQACWLLMPEASKGLTKGGQGWHKQGAKGGRLLAMQMEP